MLRSLLGERFYKPKSFIYINSLFLTLNSRILDELIFREANLWIL